MIESVSYIDACKPFIMGIGGGFLIATLPALIGFTINKLPTNAAITQAHCVGVIFSFSTK